MYTVCYIKPFMQTTKLKATVDTNTHTDNKKAIKHNIK